MSDTVRVLAPVAVLIGLRFTSTTTADVSYLLLAVYALFGEAHAIRALALSWLFTMVNPGLVPETSMAAVGRYTVLFAAAVSAVLHSGILRRHPRTGWFTASTILLGVFFVGHSLLVSPNLDVSMLKAISWTMAMATIVATWTSLSHDERRDLEGQMFWGLVLVLAASAPLVVLPVGYLRNDVGFQGILNHPQAFGPAMALLGTWAGARIFGETRPAWWLVSLTGMCIVAIVLSQSRTAGLAMIGGIGLAIVLAPSISRQRILQVLPGLRSARVWSILAIFLMAGGLMAPQLFEATQAYLVKFGRADGGGLLDVYESSRGFLMELMLENIERYPFTGIGFGIASTPFTMDVQRDGMLGLPVGAAVEKGVAFLAILEEVGVFGAAFVAVWLLHLLRTGARAGVGPFAVCLTVLLLNLGESTLFSAGGMGMLSLLLLGWAYAAGDMAPRYG